MAAFKDLFLAMWDVMVGILVPSGGLTPVAIVAWFGLLTGPLGYAITYLRGLARS